MADLPKIKIQFMTLGLTEVRKAFADIEASAIRLQTILDKQARGEGSSAGGGAAAAGRKRVSEEERNAKRIEAAKEKQFKNVEKWAAQQAAAEVREAEKAAAGVARANSKTAQSRIKTVSNIGKSVGSDIKGALSFAGGIAGAALSIGGGFTLANAFKYSTGAETAAAKASNSTNGERSKDQVLRDSRAASLSTGISQKDVIEGGQSYTAKTGKSASKELLDYVTKLSVAEDVSVKDLMDLAGIVKVQNHNLDDKGVIGLLSSFTAQGKLGPVEIKELATAAAKATATSVFYSGDQNENVKKLGTLTQLTYGITGNADEAATSVTRVSSDLLKHKGVVENVIGRKITGENGKLLDPQQILIDFAAKTKGDPSKAAAVFKDRSIRTYEAIAKLIEEGEAQEKGSGKKHAQEELAKSNNANLSPEQLDKNYQNRMATAEKKIEVAMNKLYMVVGEKIVPALEPLIDMLPQLVDEVSDLTGDFVQLIEWMVENPWTTVTIAVAASLGKAVGAEIVSQTVASALKSILSGGVEGSGAFGAMAKFGGLLGVAAVAVAAFALAVEMANNKAEMDVKGFRESGDKGQAEGQTDLDEIKGLEGKTPALEASARAAHAIADKSGSVDDQNMADEATQRLKENNDLIADRKKRIELIKADNDKQIAKFEDPANLTGDVDAMGNSTTGLFNEVPGDYANNLDPANKLRQYNRVVSGQPADTDATTKSAQDYVDAGKSLNQAGVNLNKHIDLLGEKISTYPDGLGSDGKPPKGRGD